jgi:hypothetical protein
MNGHVHHESLPGYAPGQLLVDSCPACEDRAMAIDCGISNLDPQRFAAAWQRAWQLQTRGLPSCSEAEHGMLRCLAAVRAQFERYGPLVRSVDEVLRALDAGQAVL